MTGAQTEANSALTVRPPASAIAAEPSANTTHQKNSQPAARNVPTDTSASAHAPRTRALRARRTKSSTPKRYAQPSATAASDTPTASGEESAPTESARPTRCRRLGTADSGQPTRNSRIGNSRLGDSRAGRVGFEHARLSDRHFSDGRLGRNRLRRIGRWWHRRIGRRRSHRRPTDGRLRHRQPCGRNRQPCARC